MAGSDKIYISTWKQYQEIKQFLEKSGIVKDEYGNTFKPIEYLADYNEKKFEDARNNVITGYKESYARGDWKWYVENNLMTQEEYDNFNPEDHIEIPIMNNPVFYDVWLIRNCEIDWVVKRLKEQYGYENFYTEIKEKRSLYDTFKRNGLGNNIKVKLPKYNKNLYGIEIEFPENKYELSTSYDEETDRWNNRAELKQQTCFCSMATFGKINNIKRTKKGIYRKLCKWNLPENTKITLYYDSPKKLKIIETVIKKKN